MVECTDIHGINKVAEKTKEGIDNTETVWDIVIHAQPNNYYAHHMEQYMLNVGHID